VTQPSVVDHHAEQEQRAAKWWGLRPSNARVCLRVVAGKRCVQPQRSCVCDKHQRLLDHGRIWLDEDGKHVLTGEPYNASPRELSALFADADEHGLKVRISGRSPWFPGATVLIHISAQKDDQ
jgi:hypothetical protein